MPFSTGAVWCITGLTCLCSAACMDRVVHAGADQASMPAYCLLLVERVADVPGLVLAIGVAGRVTAVVGTMPWWCCLLLSVLATVGWFTGCGSHTSQSALLLLQPRHFLCCFTVFTTACVIHDAYQHCENQHAWEFAVPAAVSAVYSCLGSEKMLTAWLVPCCNFHCCS